VSKEAPHSTRSSIGSLPHWSIRRVRTDSEKSRRNQIWFCESHRHTEQRNKTILLKSSQYSKKIGAPVEINLDIVAEETSPNHYIKSGNIPLALLLEGSFHSMFENRVLPFNQTTFESVGKKNKMIVISDDLIRNQLIKLATRRAGIRSTFRKLIWQQGFHAELCQLPLDDTDLLTFGKDLDLPLLDKEKVLQIMARHKS
jgi:hypothetical protein